MYINFFEMKLLDYLERLLDNFVIVSLIFSFNLIFLFQNTNHTGNNISKKSFILNIYLFFMYIEIEFKSYF